MQDLQSYRLRRAALALALDGNGYVHGMLPGEDRLALRLRCLSLRAEHPLVGDDSGYTVSADLAGHVHRAARRRRLSEFQTSHAKRHREDHNYQRERDQAACSPDPPQAPQMVMFRGLARASLRQGSLLGDVPL